MKQLMALVLTLFLSSTAFGVDWYFFPDSKSLGSGNAYAGGIIVKEGASEFAIPGGDIKCGITEEEGYNPGPGPRFYREIYCLIPTKEGSARVSTGLDCTRSTSMDMRQLIIDTDSGNRYMPRLMCTSNRY